MSILHLRRRKYALSLYLSPEAFSLSFNDKFFRLTLTISFTLNYNVKFFRLTLTIIFSFNSRDLQLCVFFLKGTLNYQYNLIAAYLYIHLM